MEQATKDAMQEIVSKESWTVEDYDVLVGSLASQRDATSKLCQVVSDLESTDGGPKGAAAIKLGIGRYLLCQFAQALEALACATDNKERRYFAAMCHKNLQQYDKAVDELQRAADRGFDGDRAALQMAELKALMGQLDEAAKELSRLEGKLSHSADFMYVRGLIDELAGRRQQAAEAYERARAIDSLHTPATFRLAYYCDLHGQEDRAVELYKQCISRPPVHANALMNLAVLYEDAGQYEQAVSCLRAVLAAKPNHPRARLFLKDAQASRNMYYDEEQAKRVARRNAVLDTPVTDFELSVRARNCLKKMNVRNLGDLVRTTEPELLAYKNFGETSLKEIKDMLSSKGLRLGQAMEEGSELVLSPPPPRQTASNDGVLGMPIAQIEFSIRARKALEGLNVRTLGDLAMRTEAELLACRNFGQTSLNEICKRLAEYGLSLREAS